MVDKTQRAHAANNVLNDETFRDALTDVQKSITKNLLNATTQEEREQYYQEWHGIDRAMKLLAGWASSVRHNKEVKE